MTPHPSREELGRQVFAIYNRSSVPWEDLPDTFQELHCKVAETFYQRGRADAEAEWRISGSGIPKAIGVEIASLHRQLSNADEESKGLSQLCAEYHGQIASLRQQLKILEARRYQEETDSLKIIVSLKRERDDARSKLADAYKDIGCLPPRFPAGTGGTETGPITAQVVDSQSKSGGPESDLAVALGQVAQFQRDLSCERRYSAALKECVLDCLAGFDGKIITEDRQEMWVAMSKKSAADFAYKKEGK
jgi:hypothetical protein